MSSKALQTSTTSALFIVLAVMDTVVLWVGLVRQWLMYAYGVQDIRLLSNASCKLHTFLVYWCSHLASWVLVCIACERCFVVFWPYHAKQVATKRNAVISVAILASLLLVINMQFFWTVDLDVFEIAPGYQVDGCKESSQFQYFALHIWPWIDFSLLSLAPFAILAVANISMVTRLLQRNYTRSKKLKVAPHTCNIMISNLTFVSFAVSAWFLVTTLPISVFLIKQHVWVESLATITKETQALTHLKWAVTVNISYLNNSFNLVLYVLTSRRFRNELIVLCRCKQRWTSESSRTVDL